MQRREFLQASGKIAAGSFLLNGIPVKTLALSPSFTCLEIRDRIFVMVNLFGANDTLNTVVPIQQYNIYATNRPNIKKIGKHYAVIIFCHGINRRLHCPRQQSI